MTDCRDNCPIPDGGDCPRHGIFKPAHWVRLCREKERYWQAWEEGRGPGQARPEKQAYPPRSAVSRANKTPARAQARRLACTECPDGNWNETRGFCPLVAGRPCTMRSLFNGNRLVCKHWPE